jgi:hypothetical protein
MKILLAVVTVLLLATVVLSASAAQQQCTVSVTAPPGTANAKAQLNFDIVLDDGSTCCGASLIASGGSTSSSNLAIPAGRTASSISYDVIIVWNDGSSEVHSGQSLGPAGSATYTHPDGETVMVSFSCNCVTLCGGGSVGGSFVPVNKPILLAPYFAFASLVVATTILTAVYLKRVKRSKDKR